MGETFNRRSNPVRLPGPQNKTAERSVSGLLRERHPITRPALGCMRGDKARLSEATRIFPAQHHV
jgi:hypothetical protein